MRYDVIVVGARCAGASTAMLLALKGYEVLLVDRAGFPSDHPMSTHVVWQDGAGCLQRWGLLDAAVAGCPPIARCSMDLGAFALTGRPPPAGEVRHAYTPRRVHLDTVLVRAAEDTGVEVRQRTALEGVVVDGDRVVGVRLSSGDGSERTERAELVVGADGMHSPVARAVDAPVLMERPVLQGTIWSYWSGVDLDEVLLCPGEHRAAYGVPTSDGLTLIGANWAAPAFARARQDMGASHRQAIEELSPRLAAGAAAGQREERWYNGSVPNVVRRPWGRGWALVGDAGCLKDPCTARGISDAFRDAELLADAIDSALGGGRAMADALEGYQQRRDEATLPMFEFTCQLAPFDPPDPQMEGLFGALHGNQAQTDRFWGVFAGTVPVQEFFSPDNLSQLLASSP
jgi:2-polyprenyl-6-methoxyphenol hydroxylase-like FAD-dependent oxidoreductase